MRVKNIIIFILSIAALSGWGMVIYQNNLQEESNIRLEARIMKQVDNLLGTYSSIRQEVESSEKIKGLIIQQEELRQTRDSLVKQLQDLRDENLEGNTQLQDLLKKELESVARRYSEQERMLSEYAKELTKVNSRDDFQDARLIAWEGKAAEVDKINREYHDQIRSIFNKDMQEIRQKQERSDNQISGLKSRLEQYIAQVEKKSVDSGNLSAEITPEKQKEPALR
jgi:chromosome segregation ATPase